MYLVAMVAFTVLFFLFQILASRTYKRETEWLKTDYAWLSVAAIGLIFYAIKAHQYDAELKLERETWYAENKAQIAYQRIFAYYKVQKMLDIQPTVELNTEDGSLEDNRILEKRLYLANEIIEHSGWNSFAKNYSPESMAKGIKDSFVLNQVDTINKTMSEYKDLLLELDKLQEATNSKVSKAFELNVYPILVAFVLALRLGRTTADIKRKGEKDAGSKEPKPYVFGSNLYPRAPLMPALNK